ncbi:MAG: bacteriorhodopsin-like [Actinomycetota bacterium]
MLATATSLSEGQFDLVFNVFSFVTAAMGAAAVFFVLVRGRVAPKHRLALTLSTLVVGIAAYHYFRITESWKGAYELVDGTYVPTNQPFNEGYRYADWLLTVPLLMAELVVVLALAKKEQRSLLLKLVGASAAMIILGYPGEIASTDDPIKWISFIAGTIPFLYILYVLYAEMGGALERQSARVRQLFGGLRTIILVTWSVYPLAFLAPYLSLDDSTTEVMRQVGYGIADVIAKPAFGLLLLAIAMVKSSEEGFDPDAETSSPDGAVATAA